MAGILFLQKCVYVLFRLLSTGLSNMGGGVGGKFPQILRFTLRYTICIEYFFYII
jgi:hypothetical protein